jgi:hypothetical protein
MLVKIVINQNSIRKRQGTLCNKSFQDNIPDTKTELDHSAYEMQVPFTSFHLISEMLGFLFSC